ncbi:MAG: hypothetical protein K940chlam2_01220 [Chlamydiae bacterium]|nr:hypothetical protein [Chlamydiota bacterium]
MQAPHRDSECNAFNQNLILPATFFFTTENREKTEIRFNGLKPAEANKARRILLRILNP